MIPVGYVDDNLSYVPDYQKRFARCGLDLIISTDCEKKEDFLIWIFEKNIKCLLVDHRISSRYSFSGTELVAFINDSLPDLQCIIVTNYPNDSLKEKLVVGCMIVDRQILDRPMAEFSSQLCDRIKEAVEVFDHRLDLHVEEYANLLQRRNELSATDEERYLHLYRLLRAYGEVDELPTEMMKSTTTEKMDAILLKLNLLIKDVEQRS